MGIPQPRQVPPRDLSRRAHTGRPRQQWLARRLLLLVLMVGASLIAQSISASTSGTDSLANAAGAAKHTPQPRATATPGAASTNTAVPTGVPTSTAIPTVGAAPTSTAVPTATAVATSGTGLALFSLPYQGGYVVNNPFDHSGPSGGTGTGPVLTWWGETIQALSHHEGVDFLMPQGTPILAAAAGQVIQAGVVGPQWCALLGTNVTVNQIVIEHTVGGERIRSVYLHLSSVGVQAGQTVQQGQQIGLSGQTGCATQPHLHFGTQRFVASQNAFVIIDPFGWTSTSPDPWATNPSGAPSLYLWLPGQAPAFYREVQNTLNPNAGDTAPVGITRVRYAGVNDATSPNNEFVDVTIDPRYVSGGTFDLSGWRLRTNSGMTYTFPTGTKLTSTSPTVQVYTGGGLNTPTQLYWGQASGVWNNLGDCAHLLNAAGTYLYQVTYGPAC
jgi:murein DD-endopeptidase MepM/ murein hydrolase activator NlpD